MFFYLMQRFEEWFHFITPQVFLYYSTRMMLAAMTSLLVSIFIGPYFIKLLYSLKLGQPIRKEDCPLLGQLHHKKQDTPTMGGLLIIACMLLSLFLWMDLKHPFTLILLATTIFFGFIGGYDDFLKLKYKNPKGLSAKKKMLLQGLFSLLIALYLTVPGLAEFFEEKGIIAAPFAKEILVSKAEKNSEDAYLASVKMLPLSEISNRIYVPFFREPIILFSGLFGLLSILFILFVITGSSNAVNLTDGLDGLAAGCLIMVSVSFAIFAFVSNNIDLAGYLHILYIEGSGEIAIYMAAFIGACLGFLWYNSHPAQVFMGDTGSLALGGILGVTAVLLKKELLLGIVGGVFVVETLSVILQVSSYKMRNKKRIFLCTPLHHHFEYKGWPETKVVTRFWIMGFLLSLIGLASLKFQYS
ncbi:phospho-N-acetylmuramoyl-pentapeptide-transferase [Criblamydia sequanensis]|uniref:Phospho-N-acetylmuramoyl-pentapeptide-transferase n=1 Tax=Candidatus Criblamydia sequanensis CRIB-18 TaxID=1437425 RepID=A0A090D2Y7_9BACT|nr:phospho-N-acetylmuramoyl-pentapeptide-transferase [Criblamydia sequanensis]CDR35075.1 Phospho-N-acetylmuramoyl-pentapeptide-transferase [Criblamydia sequanensis CRIB-18]